MNQKENTSELCVNYLIFILLCAGCAAAQLVQGSAGPHWGADAAASRAPRQHAQARERTHATATPNAACYSQPRWRQ
jgi:hypothetical protein